MGVRGRRGECAGDGRPGALHTSEGAFGNVRVRADSCLDRDIGTRNGTRAFSLDQVQLAGAAHIDTEPIGALAI